MMRTTDRIIASTRGTATRAIAYATSNGAARLGEVTAYLQEVYRLAPLLGIDASIVVAQSVHETTMASRPWSSHWWVERLNPAGIGITGDPAQNEQSHRWPNGTASAQSHLAHLLVYATGPADAGSLWFRVTGQSIRAVDPRYDAYVEAYGNTAQAETVAELAGTWATDPKYAGKVCARGNAVYPELPDQGGTPPVTDITFGKVPHPHYTDRIIPSDINTAWNNLGPRTIRAVVWHRMLGSLWGTDDYFRDTSSKGGAKRALTDYGVGVAAQDGQENAGDILVWNDPRGNRSPWANGRVSAPYGDGLAFVNRFGVDAVNRDATAIEISGFQTTPLDDKARDAIAGITAYWADQAQIPWDEFPAVPREARSFVIWHQEFTIGTGKECPFTTVMNETSALIERTRGVMKHYQTGEKTPTPPTYADPKPPAWLKEDLERGYPIDHVEGGLTYYAALRPYVAIREANRLQGPDIKAPKVGPRLKVREAFRANYVVRTAEGRTFVLTPYGTYVDIKALTPRVTVKAA